MAKAAVAVGDGVQHRVGDVEGADAHLPPLERLRRRDRRLAGVGGAQRQDHIDLGVFREPVGDRLARLLRIGSTGSTSTEPAKPSMKPLQRRSSATLPSSWFRQSALVPPSLRIASPATRPASYSPCPTCRSAPSDCPTSKPELIVMTGMPASTAARIGPATASAFGYRDDEAVGRLLHRRLDKRRHLLEIEGFRRAVDHLHAGLLGGGVRALLHRRPEAVAGGAVRDHDEAQLVLGMRKAGERQSRRQSSPAIGKVPGSSFAPSAPLCFSCLAQEKHSVRRTAALFGKNCDLSGRTQRLVVGTLRLATASAAALRLGALVRAPGERDVREIGERRDRPGTRTDSWRGARRGARR